MLPTNDELDTDTDDDSNTGNTGGGSNTDSPGTDDDSNTGNTGGGSGGGSNTGKDDDSNTDNPGTDDDSNTDNPGTDDDVNTDNPGTDDTDRDSTPPVTDPLDVRDADGILDAILNLNNDINVSSASIENELKLLNSTNRSINSKLAQDEQTAINLDDTNSLIKSQTDALADSVNSVGETVESIASDVSNIRDAIDDLGNLDLASSTNNTCISNNDGDNCSGYYTPMYPDGFSGIAESHFDAIKVEVVSVVDGIFGQLDLSNSVAPSFCLTVPLGGTHCFNDYMDFDYIFAFVRFGMMFCTVLLCRQLIFGG